jgi:hypothetical protein
MDFALFVFLNFLLLVRPEDLYPPIAGFRLYLVTIVVCTVTALPALQRTLTRENLSTQPIAVCALGMLGATFLSFAFRGRFADGLDFCGEFAKVVLFFFLLISVVNTPERLRAYVAWVAAFVNGVMAISLLQFFELAEFPGIEPLRYNEYNPATGEDEILERILSVGLFSDPNDLCVILAFGMALCLGLAMTSRGGLGMLVWLLPLVPMGYACLLTKSRGGVLAILAGIAGTAFAKLGVRRSVPFLALGLPLLLLGIGGRQATIAGGGGTAHERLMLWAEGFSELFRMPFHIPTGLAPGFYVQELGLLAHNSYVNAYVELGLLGGGLFLTAVYLAVRRSYTALSDPDAPPWAKALGPYLFGALFAYAVGCYSLTRNFHIPTYLALGLAAAYIQLALPRPDPRDVVDSAWWGRFAVLSVVGLVALKYATQLLGILGV